MEPELSEFSFGYAVTEAFVNKWRPALSAAPAFPSLIREGQPGGGYDVNIQRNGIPFFLQFKLAHCMVRATASEARAGLFQVPFYRMHLRPLRLSEQHRLLCKLQGTGNIVRYVAPVFHTIPQFNDVYLEGRVLQNCIFIAPLWIGDLDAGRHHVAYTDRTDWRVLSEPRRGDHPADEEEFTAAVRRDIGQRGAIGLTDASLRELAGKMVSILEEEDSDLNRNRARRKRMPVSYRSILLGLENPLQQVSYLARTFFGSECIVAWAAEEK